jgi:transcriptional regulator with XRE-family HTH domain
MRYERDETIIDIPTLLKISDHYNVPIEWLILGDKQDAKTCPNISIVNDQDFILKNGGNTDTKYIPIPDNSLFDWAANLESIQFLKLWGNYMNEISAMKGWIQIEMLKRFPEFIDWLKTHRDTKKPGLDPAIDEAKNPG